MAGAGLTAEHRRLEEARRGAAPWKSWGPYLSERQWGTVREDYSNGGDAWSYFTHDQARSRAYRWGEDGIAGVSDDRQTLCLALALWNEADPILKERMFGLTNNAGNHGEDVKEYWFYLDSTPTHSYMRLLYKYPQRAFPYEDLRATNQARGKQDFEYELLDTGVFDEDRYFDIVVEYAKNAPDDLLMQVTAFNRGPDAAPLHLLPTLWFRNTWAWDGGGRRPRIALEPDGHGGARASHEELGVWLLYTEPEAELLFCENETNSERLFGTPNATPYVKDAIDQRIVHGRTKAVNPARGGTKLAVHHALEVPAGGSRSIRVRLVARGAVELDAEPGAIEADAERGAIEPNAERGAIKADTEPGAIQAGAERGAIEPNAERGAIEADTEHAPLGVSFTSRLSRAREEADEFYAHVIPAVLDADAAAVTRQALAGMLWSKQYYEYDVHRWLAEHGIDPWDPSAPRSSLRNVPWFHMLARDVISMPDKWEYPWFAAWDLAFHCAPLALVDVDFAKQQVELLMRTAYMHPNGQIPAYEWNFSDVNPPVTAWAALWIYEREAEQRGEGDRDFLKLVFGRLLTNFTWWVNRKDPDDRNVFQGGFLGLDNIGLFDRSAPLPGGGSLEQADGTAWMALYCQWMMQIANELAREDPTYLDLALKFLTHFMWISIALEPADGQNVMWSESDSFYFDVLRQPDTSTLPLRVRSLVGLLPMCAATVFDGDMLSRYPLLAERLQEGLAAFDDISPGLAKRFAQDSSGRRIAALVSKERLRQILQVLLDEDEFLGPHGIRSVSRRHLAEPVVLAWGDQRYQVSYLPAESDTGMFGGNSNWRGPVWFPMNMVILRGLLQFYRFYGEEIRIECPTGSGQELDLLGVVRHIAERLTSTFTKDEDGRRPVFGGIERFQTDPNWRDLVLFHEYFHGDNGAGLGASHQTGWTGVVAVLFMLGDLLEVGDGRAAPADRGATAAAQQLEHAG